MSAAAFMKAGTGNMPSIRVSSSYRCAAPASLYPGAILACWRQATGWHSSPRTLTCEPATLWTLLFSAEQSVKWSSWHALQCTDIHKAGVGACCTGNAPLADVLLPDSSSPIRIWDRCRNRHRHLNVAHLCPRNCCTTRCCVIRS